MLTAAIAIWLAQARIQKIPECPDDPILRIIRMGPPADFGTGQKAESADPAIAKVKVLKDGHVTVTGVSAGWVDVTVTEKGKPKPRLLRICVAEDAAVEHCSLCDLPLFVKFSRPIALMGTYPDVAAWRKVQAEVRARGLTAPPAPPDFVPKVVEAANQALRDAALAPRLSVVARLPVLDPMPKTPAEEELVSGTLAPHLPVLLELLAP